MHLAQHTLENLLRKMKDPSSFIIHCDIGGLSEKKVLAYSWGGEGGQKLGLGKPRPTWMTLQLTD